MQFTPPDLIGTTGWRQKRPNAIGIYNTLYPKFKRSLGPYPLPWIVIGRGVYERFHTHAEALDCAFKEAGK